MDLTDSELFWTRFYKGLVSMEEAERYIRSLEKRIYNLEQIEKEHQKQNGELQEKFLKIEEIRDKAEVMDYYTLPNVIEDLNKLLGEEENE